MDKVRYIVVVHGMGDQRRGEVVLRSIRSFAKTLKIDWTRHATVGIDTKYGGTSKFMKVVRHIGRRLGRVCGIPVGDSDAVKAVRQLQKEFGWIELEELEVPISGPGPQDGNEKLRLRFYGFNWEQITGDAYKENGIPFRDWSKKLIKRIKTEKMPGWILNSLKLLRPLLLLLERIPFLGEYVLDTHLGDIYAYCHLKETRTDAIRSFHLAMRQLHENHLRDEQFGDENPHITVVSHSLGSALAMEALIRAHEGDPESRQYKWVQSVDNLVTMGSPADKFMTLWKANYKDYTKEQVDKWMNPRFKDIRKRKEDRIRHCNYCDEQDPVGGELDFAYQSAAVGAVFRKVEDRVFVKYALPLFAHGQYWKDEELTRRIFGMAVKGSDPPEQDGFRGISLSKYFLVLVFSYVVIPSLGLIASTWALGRSDVVHTTWQRLGLLWSVVGASCVGVTILLTALMMQWRLVMTNPRGPHGKKDRSLRWRRGIGKIFTQLLLLAPFLWIGALISVFQNGEVGYGWPTDDQIKVGCVLGFLISISMVVAQIYSERKTDPEREKLPTFEVFMATKNTIKRKRTKKETTSTGEIEVDPAGRAWEGPHMWSLLGILLAIIAVSLFIPGKGRIGAWILNLGLMTGFMVVSGHAVTGLKRGFLLNSYNRFSISRLQMIGWTLIVFSAFLTAALYNIRLGVDNPLNIEIPDQLWILMGISTASAIGAPAIQRTKSKKKGDKKDFDKTSKQLANGGQATIEKPQRGKDPDILVRNESREDSRWRELFQGDEAGNAASLDLGKLQMFFITFIIVFAYAVSLGKIFASNTAFVGALPDVNESMTVLLGISHTGYLANKAVTHSRET